MPKPTGPELDSLITDQVGGARGEGLRAVVDAVLKSRADLMPVYGLHNVAASGRASAVNTLASGAHAAGLGRPTVVITFGDATVPFAPRHTADWLDHADLDTEDLADRIAALGPDQVLIVNAASCRKTCSGRCTGSGPCPPSWRVPTPATWHSFSGARSSRY
ncbi:hypothetical protein E4K10_35680 [Streptomyces sp. T1317-0309]|nr:hypothetical protein E4K10_35680 [Streptomyces sp. T1317-0309]